MATVSGIHGYVDAGDYSEHVSNWSIDMDMDTPEDTNWNDWTEDNKGWRSYVEGLREWSGSFESFHPDSFTDNIIPTFDTVSAKFYVDEYEEMGYQGDILITSVSVETGVEDVATMSVDFQGTDVLEVGDISGS